MQTYGTPALTATASSASLADVVRRRAAARPDEVMLRKLSGGATWHDMTARNGSSVTRALEWGRGCTSTAGRIRPLPAA